MPYTKKEKELWNNLVKEYGKKKAQQVYHAMLNSGKYDETIFGKRSLMWRERRKKRAKARKRKRTLRRKKRRRRK